MEDKIDDAIMILLGTITRTMKSEDVMRITQSALNLAHVKSIQNNFPCDVTKERRTKGASA